MATNDELLAFDNKLKTHYLQCLAIEIYKSKNKLNPSFMWKTYIRKKVTIFKRKGYFFLNSKRKHSEIWNKFIKFQRKSFVEQPTNKV